MVPSHRTPAVRDASPAELVSSLRGPMMMAYASRTGTRRNLAALRAHGWRLMVSATGVLRSEGFRYALDNGAWTAHQQGTEFDARKFGRALARMGSGADWIVVPDIVAGGRKSLELSVSWLPRVLAVAPCVLAVQNGMSPRDVMGLLGPRVGLFVGGDTEWKLETIPMWCDVGRQAGCIVHVGRVNTARRIALCDAHGVTSFDGTSATRYAVTLPRLDRARRQLSIGAY